jgi:hypothetical protein
MLLRRGEPVNRSLEASLRLTYDWWPTIGRHASEHVAPCRRADQPTEVRRRRPIPEPRGGRNGAGRSRCRRPGEDDRRDPRLDQPIQRPKALLSERCGTEPERYCLTSLRAISADSRNDGSRSSCLTVFVALWRQRQGIDPRRDRSEARGRDVVARLLELLPGEAEAALARYLAEGGLVGSLRF